MRNVSKKILGLTLGLALSLGCGLAMNNTHKEVVETKAEYDVTFAKIKATADLANLEEGLYLIEATYNYSKNSYDAIMKAEYTNSKKEKLVGTVLNKSNGTYVNPDNAYIWKLTKFDNNYWTLYNESTKKYVAAVSKENQAALVENIDDYAKWKIEQSSRSGKSDCFDFVNAKRTEKQYLGNGGNSTTGGPFACYTHADTTCLSLYKKVLTPEEEAETWGKNFMETDTALTCEEESADNFDDLSFMWSDFEEEYNKISDDAKNIVKTATADNNGSTYLAKAVARYDHIMNRYPSLNNFIQRATYSSGRTIAIFDSNNNIAIMSVVIISFVGITVIGGYLFLKKQKQN